MLKLGAEGAGSSVSNSAAMHEGPRTRTRTPEFPEEGLRRRKQRRAAFAPADARRGARKRFSGSGTEAGAAARTAPSSVPAWPVRQRRVRGKSIKEGTHGTHLALPVHPPIPPSAVLPPALAHRAPAEQLPPGSPRRRRLCAPLVSRRGQGAAARVVRAPPTMCCPPSLLLAVSRRLAPWRTSFSPSTQLFPASRRRPCKTIRGKHMLIFRGIERMLTRYPGGGTGPRSPFTGAGCRRWNGGAEVSDSVRNEDGARRNRPSPARKVQVRGHILVIPV